MSGNLKGFNAETVEPASFDVLPAGDYEVAILASSKEPTKAGTGHFIALELEVINGQYAGRKLWDRLNLWNPNAKAVEIAKATLSAICRAVNVLTPNDASDLHNKPLCVKVVVTSDPQFGERNEIKAYKPSKGIVADTLPPRGQPAPDDEIPF